jgi:hypothetical protein
MKTLTGIIIGAILFATAACTVTKTTQKPQPDTAIYINPAATENGDGTQDRPYNTLAGITLEAGRSYLLARDTTLRETIDCSDIMGTAEAPVRIGAYDAGEPGSGAAPVIDGTIPVSGWTLLAGTVYRSSAAIPNGALLMKDGITLSFAAWNTDAATSLGAAADQSFSYDHTTGYLYLKSAASPSGEYRASTLLYGIVGFNAAHIDISDLSIRGASFHGIKFEDSAHITVTDCAVSDCGGYYLAPVSLYAGNGIEFGDASTHCAVRNCTIRDIFDSGVSPQTYSAGKHASDFTFTGLTIERCGFAGVEIAVLFNGGMTDSSITGVTVSGVTAQRCGKGWSGRRYGTEGRGIKIKADISGTDTSRSLSGVLIEDCAVSDNAGEGMYIGGNAGTVTIRRCTIQDNALDGILAQEPGATTLLLDIASSVVRGNGSADNRHGLTYNVPSGQGLRVRHTTLFDNTYLGLNLWASAGEIILQNNLFHASSARVHLYTPGTLAGATVENNCFTEFGASNIIGCNSAAYTSVTSFEAGASVSASNIGAAAPGVTADLRIAGAASACYQAGTPTVIITDRAGTAYRNPPSIGAYELP